MDIEFHSQLFGRISNYFDRFVSGSGIRASASFSTLTRGYESLSKRRIMIIIIGNK